MDDIKSAVRSLKEAPIRKELGAAFYVSERLLHVVLNDRAKEKEVKKYKLKKDLLTVKAGALFKLDNNELVAVDDNVIPYITQMKYIINFDEWFEEVRDFEEWKPKLDESFKVMNIDGSVTDYYNWADSASDRFLLGTGNCYPMSTPDKLIIKEQKLIPQAMHRLKMAAKKAWFEFDGSEGPDWNDSRQKKFSIKRWHVAGAYLANYASNEQYLGGVYFPTQESAQTYIDNNKADLELLFGVER